MQLSFSPWFHFQLQIYYEDTDFSGVVYHPNFLKYFERAREQVIGANELKRLWHSDGIGFAVYRSELTCQEGVEFADILDVRTVLPSKANTAQCGNRRSGAKTPPGRQSVAGLKWCA